MATNPHPSQTDSRDPINIAMHPALVPAFKAWLESRHLHLAGPMTSEAGEPWYFIGIDDDHPLMKAGRDSA